MLTNKNILATTLRTIMNNKKYEIWISVEKIIICNLKNCAEPSINFSKNILKNYFLKLKKEKSPND